MNVNPSILNACDTCLIRDHAKSSMWDAKRNWLQRRGLIAHFILFYKVIPHVETNKMCRKSILVVISFPKIIFDIEHYECKSQMMHANDRDACGCVV